MILKEERCVIVEIYSFHNPQNLRDVDATLSID